ncbi:MAG: Gfo/Idh/MocA family oxidoreductase [Nostocoides sp.]
MTRLPQPIRLALIGAGRIGTHHAAALQRHVHRADLVAVADAHADAAHRLGADLGVRTVSLDAVFDHDAIDAVVITASSVAHHDLITRAAAADKAVFCEKPAGMSLADIRGATQACQAAGVPFQVGFNRRFARDFAAAYEVIDAGGVGTVQLMRSVTRDPGLANPAAVPPGTIFTQTLIHDFDTLLWLNPGAEPVEVHTYADALVAPDFREQGLLDTAVVTIRFDNGAIATAEANFSASYGYDVRGEVFGSEGMVTIGGPANLSLARWDADGMNRRTARSDTDLLHEAYVAEFDAFCAAVAGDAEVRVGGQQALAAFEVALAAWRSADEGRRVPLAEVRAEAVVV